jgi:hypothetical protein
MIKPLPNVPGTAFIKVCSFTVQNYFPACAACIGAAAADTVKKIEIIGIIFCQYVHLFILPPNYTARAKFSSSRILLCTGSAKKPFFLLQQGKK